MIVQSEINEAHSKRRTTRHQSASQNEPRSGWVNYVINILTACGNTPCLKRQVGNEDEISVGQLSSPTSIYQTLCFNCCLLPEDVTSPSPITPMHHPSMTQYTYKKEVKQFVNFVDEKRNNDAISGLLLFLSCQKLKCSNARSPVLTIEECLRNYTIEAAETDDATIWHTLATKYFSMGKLKEAEMAMHTAVQIAPNDASFLHHYGMMLEATGKINEAIHIYEKSKCCDPQQQPFMPAAFNLGTLKRRINRLDEARKEFITILSREPEHRAALCLLADCYERQFKFQQAAKLIQRAHSLYPDDHQIARVMVRLLPFLSSEDHNNNDSVSLCSTECPEIESENGTTQE